MSNNESKLSFFPISSHYKKMEKILTLNTTVFEPCHPKVEWEWSWKKLRNVKFGVHFTKHGEWDIMPISSAVATRTLQSHEMKLLRQRIDEIKGMIQKLSKDVATKTDLKRTQELLIKNQTRLQTMLKENMEDLKRTLGRDIERKVGKQKAKKFWELLEKVATISDIVDFAKHVRDLLIFLHEQKIIQIALPFVLKMILG